MVTDRLTHLEVFMFQCSISCDPFLWVVCEEPVEHVKPVVCQVWEPLA